MIGMIILKLQEMKYEHDHAEEILREMCLNYPEALFNADLNLKSGRKLIKIEDLL